MILRLIRMDTPMPLLLTNMPVERLEFLTRQFIDRSNQFFQRHPCQLLDSFRATTTIAQMRPLRVIFRLLFGGGGGKLVIIGIALGENGYMVKDKDVSQKDWRYEPDTFDYARYKVHFIALALAALIGIGVLLNLPSYWENVFITAIGLAFTVFILDKNAEDRAIRQRKEELILQMGSPDNGFAVEAARLLRLKGWLTDGSLKGAHLTAANLRQAGLGGTNLQSSDLSNADLSGAYLGFSDLEDANLNSASLFTADLTHANLKVARLSAAKLRIANMNRANLLGAIMTSADVSGADFQGANLQWAELSSMSFSSDTILPDGSHWTPDTDMTRFTDPNHPQFWRSDDPQSPAYRAREG